MNAAIVEGTLRALFSDVLHKDSVQLGELSSQNKTPRSYQAIVRSYGTLTRLKDEVELKGGWENIKRQYKEYLNVELDKLGSNDLKQAIDTIFVIRNAAAHGTTFTIPKEKMAQEDKGIYPYKWQSKLHGMDMYVRNQFDQDFFSSLRRPDFARHFIEQTQEFFNLLSKLELFPAETQFHFQNLEYFTFGKDNSAYRKYRKEGSEPKK